MAVKLSHLFLLQVMPSLSLTSGHKCSTSDSSCNQCIQSGPECAWCTAPNSNIHCHTVKGLQRAGCHKGHIYKPQSSVQVIRNDSRYAVLNTSLVIKGHVTIFQCSIQKKKSKKKLTFQSFVLFFLKYESFRLDSNIFWNRKGPLL